MMRQTYAGAFLLLEGECDDKVFCDLICGSACTIRWCGGKPNALGASNLLVGRGVQGVLTVVDADFSRLEGRDVPPPNVLLTDTHDVETMLLESPAFDKVLTEYASPEKLAALGEDARGVLTRQGIEIGYLRWASEKYGLALTFTGLRFKLFVDRDALTVDVHKMIRAAAHNSKMPWTDDAQVKEKIDSLRDADHDPWQLCCGSDLIELLSIGLQRLMASRARSEVAPGALEKALRLAFEPSFFKGFDLYELIRSWERANPPFRVLSSALA